MSQYGIKEVMNFVIASYNPIPFKRKPLIVVDYAQMTEVVQGAERLNLDGGRGNARLMSFDHSKVTSVNVTLPLVDIRLLAEISGDCITKRFKDVFKRENLYVLEDDTGESYVKLKNKAIANSLFVNELIGFRDIGEALVLAEGGTIGENEFQLEADGLTIKLNKDSHPAGSELIVFYHYTTQNRVETLTINPMKFPKAISFYGDMLMRNQFDEEDEVWNVVGHKGRIQPNYTLTMSGTDATVLELTIDLYAYREAGSTCDQYVEYFKDESEGGVGDCCQDDPESPTP